MARETRRRTPAGGGTKAKSSTKPTSEGRASKKVEDEDDYEDMRTAKPEAEKADTFKVDDKKQKKRIGFPLRTKTGGVAMVKVPYFKAKFGTTLADGKWHAFQAPINNAELMEVCKNHPNLEYKTDRATLVIVYDTDSKGKVYGKGADIGYEILAIKINNPKLIELQDIDEEDDLTAVDLYVRLDASKDVKFQDMRFKVAGDALWLNDMEAEAIEAEAKELSKKLKEVIAYEYSDDKIEALIGDGDDDDEDDEEYEDDDIDGEEEDEEEEDEEDEDEEDEPAPSKRSPRRASKSEPTRKPSRRR